MRDKWIIKLEDYEEEDEATSEECSSLLLAYETTHLAFLRNVWKENNTKSTKKGNYQ